MYTYKTKHRVIGLNKTKFIVRIVSAEDGIKSGYVCESDVAAKVYLSASEAVNKTYNNLFNNKTRYSGPSVLGFDNENITQELLSDVVVVLGEKISKI